MENQFASLGKVALVLFILLAVCLLLYCGATILMPLFFAVLLSILLNPAVNFLQAKNIPRTLAVFLVLIISITIVTCLCLFLFYQLTGFSEFMPQLKIQLDIAIKKFLYWLSLKSNISYLVLVQKAGQLLTDTSKNLSGILGTTLSTVTSVLVLLFLIPIYTFMFLFYKPLLLKFISSIFEVDKHERISNILSKSKLVIQNYLNGLIIESAIVSALNSVGLYIIGMKFAILFGIIGGLLNIIPYVGGMIAVVLMMTVALATLSAKAALWVLVWFIIVQFIDNNVLMHYIVSSKVKINALASIIAVLAGGALCGIGGMFLAIPAVAFFKIIFDHIDTLKPYGVLLGDDMPSQNISFFRSRKNDY